MAGSKLAGNDDRVEQCLDSQGANLVPLPALGSIGDDSQGTGSAERLQADARIIAKGDGRIVVSVYFDQPVHEYRSGIEAITRKNDIEYVSMQVCGKGGVCPFRKVWLSEFGLEPVSDRAKAASNVVSLKIESVIEIEDHG